MMIVAKLCLLVAVGGVALPDYQGPQLQSTNKSTPQPIGGGTPEPTALLLLAGGAVAYGGLRLRKRIKGSGKES